MKNTRISILLILVQTIGLKCDFFAKNQFRCRLLRSLTKSLTLLWAVDAVETDAFSAVIVKYFDGVAVEDANYMA
jgi:hypothetical protein